MPQGNAVDYRILPDAPFDQDVRELRHRLELTGDDLRGALDGLGKTVSHWSLLNTRDTILNAVPEAKRGTADLRARVDQRRRPQREGQNHRQTGFIMLDADAELHR